MTPERVLTFERHDCEDDVMRNGSMVRVRFVSPVEGIDPADGEVFFSNRHRVAAVYARQDRHETLFVDEHGEVVARWATRLIERIEWPDDSGDQTRPKPTVGSLEWRKEVQDRHPNAYRRWTEEEDAVLIERFRMGIRAGNLAEAHGRRPGGITARLVRLGLIQPDTRPSDVDSTGHDLDEADPGGGHAAVESPSVEVGLPDDRCRHDLLLGTCTICKYDGRPAVFVTAGGLRFHARPDCAALLEGQRHVDARGGDLEPIEHVHPGSALLEGRGACQACGSR